MPPSTTPLYTGLPLDTMNQTADPREDFKEFAWGHWIEKNPIPDEYPSWGTLLLLRDSVLANLRSLCDELADKKSSLEPGTPSAQIAQFWGTALDEEAVEASGTVALNPLFARVDAADSVDSFIEAVTYLQSKGVGSLFHLTVVPDFKQSDILRVLVSQGGLGLPDRDYYTEADKAPLLQAYRDHITRTWNLLHGDDSGAAVAETVVALETKLALVSRTRTAMRDIASLYNNRTEVELRASAFPWVAAFRGLGASVPEFVNEATPEFFSHVVSDLTAESLPQYKTYAKWHVLHQLLPYFPSQYVDANFAFSQKLSGTKELAPRWKRVVEVLNTSCGDLLGAVYCDRYFTSSAKEAMLELVGYLKLALREKIDGLDWMTPATKLKSIEKLDSFRAKVGYPDQWIDLSSIKLAGTYADMVLELHRFRFADLFGRANKPPEPWRWEMPPQVVNAYYHPMYNEIVFPAAILQSPTFNEDVEAFNARTKVVVDQFNGYEILGKSVNGQMTLGENIADIGGLKIAFRAMELYFGDHPKPGLIDGFSPEQRFFLSWSQFWASHAREEQALKLLSVDVHSPGQLRSVAPLKNLPEFYKAFNVGEGHGMYLPKEQRAAVW
ncbi:hypothetical protein DYB34_007325 [Aphanomyces astaci]|uniref:Peptidase M13 N-terminal domain-containing protein n=1 Tax=Aphanomyces astaci TaxID=112090 RepID=A0A418CF61_APHAT|nr:hypothetical protein DYB34_007325 [Aphanomyces astaci]